MGPRVVLDTNVLVSALGWRGAPYQIFRLCVTGRVSLLASPSSLPNSSASCPTRSFSLPPTPSVPVSELVMELAVIVRPTFRVSVVEADDSDNRILKCGLPVTVGGLPFLDLKDFAGAATPVSESPRAPTYVVYSLERYHRHSGLPRGPQPGDEGVLADLAANLLGQAPRAGEGRPRPPLVVPVVGQGGVDLRQAQLGRLMGQLLRAPAVRLDLGHELDDLGVGVANPGDSVLVDDDVRSSSVAVAGMLVPFSLVQRRPPARAVSFAGEPDPESTPQRQTSPPRTWAPAPYRAIGTPIRFPYSVQLPS